MSIQSFVIIRDRISNKEVPRVVHATTAQEGLAIEFGCHFARLMNEERDDAEVEVIRANLNDGHVIPVNGRYKIHSYKRFDGTAPTRYGGRQKAEYKWIGMSTKKICKDILARAKYLEMKKAELCVLHIPMEEAEERNLLIQDEINDLVHAAHILEKYLKT